jgi:hypothetical protein
MKKILLAAAASLLPMLAHADSLGGINDPLHGVCPVGAFSCFDTGNQVFVQEQPIGSQATAFGFAGNPGGISGTLSLDFLIPTNELSGFTMPTIFEQLGPNASTSFAATLHPGLFTAASGFLDTYLGISGSPANPFSNMLGASHMEDLGATQFEVFTLTLPGTFNFPTSNSVPDAIPRPGAFDPELTLQTAN